MSDVHNHPPRCCCGLADKCDCAGRLIQTTAHEQQCATQQPCPACPDHGRLATLNQCGSCHVQIGQTHTDSCTTAPGHVWTGYHPDPESLAVQCPTCESPARGHHALLFDGLPCTDPWHVSAPQ